MIRPTMLTVDYDPQPLGLDNPCRGFSWAAGSEQRDQVQSAYQILVASCREGLDAGTGDVWDTGKVASNRTAAIEYDGKRLQSVARYFWKVRVWDGAGIESESDPAWFNMGLLQMDDWRAKWIGSGPSEEVKVAVEENPSPEVAEKAHGPIAVDDRSTILRREWAIDQPVRRAMLYVCGLGYYHAWINGERVGDYVLTPSRTGYRKRVLYDAYDVTDLLREGDNAIGVMLGNGWFDPAKKYWGWQMQWYGTKRAILQMHLDYEDGSSDLFVSDGAWKRAPGPVLDHCLYDGETYDANEEIPGWNQPGCDDSGWDGANEVEPPGGRLAAHPQEPIKVNDSLRPIAMWERGPGAWVFDLGQNFSGWCRLTMSGPKGTRVVLHYAENIHPDGMKAYVDYLGTTATDRILPGDRYGDWCQADGFNAMGKPLLASTFYYLYDAMLVARMAKILGKDSDAEKYSALAAEIRDAFNGEYYDAEKHLYGERTQCEQSMALLLDLPPEEDREQVLGRLVSDIMNSRLGHLTTGVLGSKYVMDVMARLGRADVGYHVATRTDFPSWGHMTDGYTTLWETWWREMSNSHVMFGSVDAWFYKVLAGIQPLADHPGYEKVRIQPYFPEDLSWVRGAIHTVRGRIASAWRKEKGHLYLDGGCPSGS